jgi:hypothetical protein
MEFNTLIQQPEVRRDDAWEAAFLTLFPQLKVQIESEQAKQGPDGFPYLFVSTEDQGTEPVVEVVRWLADKGIGLVVNAHKMLPDYVFPYGMLWNFVETGRFLMPLAADQTSGEVVYGQKKKVLTGPPSEKYLPPYVRKTIAEFLRAQGIENPRVLVVTTEDFKEVDLVLSETCLKGIAKAEHQKFAEMLAWFLPLHYTLVIGAETGLPNFYSL